VSLLRVPLLLAALLALGGCSGLVANLAADGLAGGGGAFASDDDPELVREAIPFGLKTLESLLAASPDNPRLLLAAASGFTQYAYAFVQQDADLLADTDPERARALHARARRLYARAHAYGLRGLAERDDDFPAAFARDRQQALRAFDEKEDAPLLYWTAASLAAQVALSKTDLAMVGRLPEVEALMARALELDEAYDSGSLHEFYVTYEASRAGTLGGSLERARAHYERAAALSGGQRVGPWVAWAELVAVQQQDRRLFDTLLERALAFDVDEAPAFRLVNLVAQRRARWLKARAGDLFLED
jgi:hypothetical protein